MELLLMNKNRVAGRFDRLHHLVWQDETLMPLYFRRRCHLEGWLESRAIDDQRPNARRLKRAIGLPEREDLAAMQAVHAATVTDTYWLKYDDENLCWEQVRFDKPLWDQLALTGKQNTLPAPEERLHTPELTNIGSFEKCWRKEQGVWWLYKQADEWECFSEWFISLLGTALGFPMAEYQPGEGCIKTRDFTGGTLNFEPLDALMGSEVDDYPRTYRALEQYGRAIASDYVAILFMDALCANPDRHSFNLGVLREPDTGRVLRLAPNFDNNMALVCRGLPRDGAAGDLLIQDFNGLLAEGVFWKGYSENAALPTVTPALLERILCKTGTALPHDAIISFIMKRYAQMQFSC